MIDKSNPAISQQTKPIVTKGTWKICLCKNITKNSELLCLSSIKTKPMMRDSHLSFWKNLIDSLTNRLLRSKSWRCLSRSLLLNLMVYLGLRGIQTWLLCNQSHQDTTKTHLYTSLLKEIIQALMLIQNRREEWSTT